MYGLNINFQANIQNEIECIAMATPEAKGACVYETETGRTCRFITKKECQEMKSRNPSAEFHQGILCSNPDLGADCGPTKQTTCVEGRDEVYFVDSCGNIANVYDSSKINDIEYWSKIQAPTCGVGTSNAGSPDCGNCDYYLGSTCKPYDRSIDPNKPTYGNNICRDLSCEYEGKEYNHGETWCVNGNDLRENPGITGNEIENFDKEGNLPGSRDFRLVCYNGEVTVEPCADFRQEVCVQSEVGGFKTAACRANLWRDCYVQDNKKDCENKDKRDCKWIIGKSILTGEEGEELVYDVGSERLVPKEEDDDRQGASCIPEYPPGFDFWNEGTNAEDICARASTECTVRYERGMFGDWKAVEYQEGFLYRITRWMKKKKEEVAICLPDNIDKDDLKENKIEIKEDWKEKMSNLCSALGDCGVSVNYVDNKGYYKEDDFFTILGAKKEGEE